MSNALTQPLMRVFDQSGGLNTDVSAWDGSAEMVSLFESVGAFALDPAMTDAARVVTLQPGAYTVHVSDAAGFHVDSRVRILLFRG